MRQRRFQPGNLTLRAVAGGLLLGTIALLWVNRDSQSSVPVVTLAKNVDGASKQMGSKLSPSAATSRPRHNQGVGVATPIPAYDPTAARKTIQLCQVFCPGESPVRCGVDCRGGCGCCEPGWDAARPIPWQALTQGEYIGPPRAPHVPEYRVRVGDELEFIYRRRREQATSDYRFNVGDKIRVESMTEDKLARELEILIDGTVTLPPSIRVQAAGRTVDELTRDLENRYKELYKVPAITVTPIDTERRLQDLLEAVDRRAGSGGLVQVATVSPEGTVQLPGIGNLSVQGLSIDEIQGEVEARYANIVLGIGVTPKLTRLAPHFIYVGGEVRNPNQYEITTPTTAIMAVVRAGGWNFGANLREIVILRRSDDWRLIATKVDLHDALLGRAPCPYGEIWLRDTDIVYVPKSKMLLRTDFLDLIFTKGIYRAIPLDASVSASSTL